MKTKEIPFIAFSDYDLVEKEVKTATCPNCGKKHKIKYGTDNAGQVSKVMGFVDCGKETYLITIKNQII